MNEIIESLYQRKSVRAYEDRTIPEEMKKKEEMEAALRSELPEVPGLPGLPEVSLRFHSTVKHVFSHRVHLLSVFSGTVEEAKTPKHRDFAWWTSQQIREAGTTSWLLLVIFPRSIDSTDAKDCALLCPAAQKASKINCLFNKQLKNR